MRNNIPIFILCGGLGTRIKEETEFRPKPMVPIGENPILIHIMNSYAKYGFKRFVLCTGFKSEVIKDYFLRYSELNSDFSIDFNTNTKKILSIDHNLDWDVTLAYTGAETMTGGRIAIAAEKYLNGSEHFGVTYGDGLCDADLNEHFDYHLSHNKIGTVLGVNPPSRFGEIKLDQDTVVEFSEKPAFNEKWINGGFFFFKKEFLGYLSKDKDCVLEKNPLVNLAKDSQLNLFKHKGFWACMDTQRDRDYLTELLEKNEAPWI
ncbi:glucose-1-phosphate cytidylyltransferase [Pedobacter ginsengisoli]|uniref:Glucose-1-phosphate cytidylyltransferase n=1 Tax=Pedobacter ginsengisoli TaxID=363852 RepID=A0A2D1U8S0_9SPHI|nr:sugar phosphate nucleotidyltransferase [Pedobacter ginsengisoli]ATP57976.1 glucose-1-phosphate cytidylyltransferase [Pedobacter ginsengisoli]